MFYILVVKLCVRIVVHQTNGDPPTQQLMLHRLYPSAEAVMVLLDSQLRAALWQPRLFVADVEGLLTLYFYQPLHTKINKYINKNSSSASSQSRAPAIWNTWDESGKDTNNSHHMYFSLCLPLSPPLLLREEVRPWASVLTRISIKSSRCESLSGGEQLCFFFLIFLCLFVSELSWILWQSPINLILRVNWLKSLQGFAEKSHLDFKFFTFVFFYKL